MKALERSEELASAFALFSQETAKLEALYQNLQEEFQTIHAKLEHSLSTVESILTHISEGLIFIALDGRISLFNHAAAKVTGLSPQEVLSTSFWDHFPDTFFGFSMQQMTKLKGSRLSFLSLKQEDKTYELELSLSCVPSKGIFLLLRDITEKRRLEQAAKRNDRLKELGEMAASLAHEIRNPLGGIQGFAALLHRELEDRPHLQKKTEAIQEGVAALNQLVISVLNYSRPLEAHFSMNNLSTLLEELLELVKADASLDGVCELFYPQKPLLVHCDAHLLKRALLNVIQNAFQASSKSIKIELQEKENCVIITLVDKGEGISRDHLETIFTPFFTTKNHGTGLGLSEAQKIIQTHGGTISVTSEVGKGSTFIIKVPTHVSNRDDTSCR